MSARTKLYMNKHSIAAPDRSIPIQSVKCFISITDETVKSQLQSLGVNVNCKIGNTIVAQLPQALLGRVIASSGVKSLSVSIPMELCNDSARYYGNVDAVQEGIGLPLSFAGRDVIIGIIDVGIDFNHINFIDANGKSRVRRVYMPQDTTGISPVIDGDTLPGSHYETAEQIALLTTDTPNATHGTHTTGTAAGSYMTNGLHGVAPEADLVLCGMPALYDTDIACTIKYIIDYAKREGKSVVISMSFSSQEGAHDGTSPLCRLFDELSDAGQIFVVSAGNNARERIYLQHVFTNENDTVYTYIDNYSSSSSYKGFVSSWSETDKPHYLGLTVIDKYTHSEVLSMPIMPINDSAAVLNIDSIPEFLPYLTGRVLYASAVEDNGRFHSIVEMNVKAIESARYRVGIKIIGEPGEMFRAWSSGIIMINDASVPGYTSAVRSSCISDLATADKVLSVGAYCTRRTIPSVSEGTYEYPRSTPPDIAYFSSYGPDARGISRPDICAPGAVLISSGSRYVESWSASLSSYVSINGVDYPYFGMMGTSMSAPYAAGVIALWLQHSPRLTVDDIRDILSATAIRDEYVLNGNSEMWGSGKIDALGGMQYVIDNYPGRIRGDFNDDGIVDVEDVNLLINMILDKQYVEYGDLNSDEILDVEDLNILINIILHINSTIRQ